MSTDLERAQQPTPDKDFLRVFNRLCVALREPQDGSGTKARVYFEVLGDLSIESLVAGANVLAREQGRRFFPTTAEWRTVAMNAQREQLRAAVAPARERTWTHECSACEDAGWRIRACDGTTAGWCGRQREHYAHDYAEPCGCRPTNHTYIRHQHFGVEA